jgi:hypothetical protein
MSEHPPTLLIIYLRPGRVEEACSRVDETLTTAGITYRIIEQQENRVSLESAAPFAYIYNEKRIVFALHTSLIPKCIEDLAQLVVTGLILGFSIKGEIALGYEMGVINNLAG